MKQVLSGSGNKLKKQIINLLGNNNECPICLEEYDLVRKTPMMVCYNQHSSCPQCLDDVYKRKKCVVCSSDLIPRKHVKKNRMASTLIEEMIKSGGETFIETNTFKYRGKAKGGKPDGEGQKVTEDGNYYKGNFKDGILDGKCEVITKNCDIFQGLADNGYLKGTFTQAFGSQISGQFTMDNFNGVKCIKKYPSGNVYQGNIKNLKAEGSGRLKFKSGNQFDGEFFRDFIRKGSQGIMSGNFAVMIRGDNMVVPEIQQEIYNEKLLENEEKMRKKRAPIRVSQSQEDSSEEDY